MAITLGKLLTGQVTVTFDEVSLDGYLIAAGQQSPTVVDLDAIAEEVALLASAAAPALGTSFSQIIAACTGYIHQDDEAHDTCWLTACLNPLHPGPCKGWKGTLYDVAPHAFHALEAARVEKANARRLQRIEHLKAQGKPIPKYLLKPIVAKPHPHAGKTANAATGEAHAAGKAISEASGVHVNEPGKVTLGQAVKQIKATDATKELGPKGKKPTVASKGIAAVIAQEKVTPTYKLTKAEAITPEQWAALSHDEKAIIRGELTKIQNEGFGPQQKKATELLDKLTVEAPKPALTDAQKAAQHAIYKPGGSTEKKIAALTGLTAEEFKGLTAKEQGSVIKELTSLYQYNPDLRKTVAEAMVKYTDGPAKSMWEKQAAKPAYTPTMTQVGKHLLESGSLGKSKASQQERLATYKALTPEEFGNLSQQEQAFVLHELNGMKKSPKVDPTVAQGILDKLTGKPAPTLKEQATKQLQLGKEPKPGTPAEGLQQAKAEPSKLGGTIPENASPLKTTILLAKHGSFDITINKGTDYEKSFEDVGVSGDHQHLLVNKGGGNWYITSKDGNQQTFVSKQQPLHLSPAGGKKPEDMPVKKAKANGTMEKAQAKVAAKAESEKPKIQAVQAVTHMTPSGLAKHIQKNGPTKVTLKGVTHKVGFQNAPDDHAKLIQVTGIGSGTGHYVIKTPSGESIHLGKGEQVAVHPHELAKLAEAAKAVAEAKPVELAKHVQDAVAMANGTAPGASWSKNHLAAYLPLSAEEFHALPTDIQTKIKNELEKSKTKFLDPKKIKAAQDLLDKFNAKPEGVNTLQAVQSVTPPPASTPALADMSPAVLDNEVAGILGEQAIHPQVNATMADIKQAKAEAETNAAKFTEKLPPNVQSDPNVLAKQKALALEASQLYLTDLSKKKFTEHLAEHHEAALGNTFYSSSDKKLIKAHAEQLKTQHAYLGTVQKQQQAKVIAAMDHLNDAVKKAEQNAIPVTPAVTLTDFDQGAIVAAYRKAWSDPASKAVLYGVKTYAQKQEMKNHPDYVPLTEDFGKLRALSGELALAHAKEHTAEQNVPTDPETGEKLPGPEKKAWLEAVLERQKLEHEGQNLLKQAQAKLDNIRTSVGLKKRSLPKLDAPAVKAAAAEAGYYKTSHYGEPNYGKLASAKGYMVAKVGPKHAVVHQTAAEKKAEKLNSPQPESLAQAAKVEPVKISGGDASIAHIPDATKKQILADFKGMPNGKYLHDPSEDVFDNLVNLAAAHGKAQPGGLSVDQVLKSIDEQHSKNLGVTNSGMLHAKITDWLGTAEGKQYAESHSTPDAKVVKQLTGELTLPEGVTLAPGQKVQPLAGPGAHDTSIPPSAFKAHTSPEAQAIQDAYKKSHGIVWTAAQKKAMTAYTGNGLGAYTGINNWLRGQTGFEPKVKQYAIDIQSAMMPLTEHTLLKRGTGWTGLPFDASTVHGMVGKTFEDKGFTSSSVAGSGGHFSGKPLQMIIEAPKGTPAVFVNGVSQYKNSENEMLLAAGTKFKVLSVEKTSGGHVLMRVRIVGDK